MKKVSAILLGLSAFAYSALPAFAETDLDPCPRSSTFFKLCDNFKADKAGGIIGTVLTFLLIAAVIIALFYLVYGGIRWITSGGDKGKVDEARKHIVAAIVGLIVAFVAYFIVQIVLSAFGLGDIRSLKIPTFGS